MLADSWATDGRRLVLFQHHRTGQAPSEIWISDDAAKTWRQMPNALPAGVNVGCCLYGHGQFLAPGSWLRREGDPDPAVCVSADGEHWTCEVIPPLDGRGRPQFLGAIAVTPTGYTSLVHYFKNPFPPYDFSIDMIGASSRTGSTGVSNWCRSSPTTCRPVSWTSPGLFAWGRTDPNLNPVTFRHRISTCTGSAAVTFVARANGSSLTVAQATGGLTRITMSARGTPAGVPGDSTSRGA